MDQLLTPQNLILLVGGGVLFGGMLTLGAYLLQRSFGRGLKTDKPRHAKIRLEDEAAFTLATIKSVVTQLKADQKATGEKLAAAERRAEEKARQFELLAREMDLGLVIFDAQGYISFSNALVRKILGIDTWSRRRYTEIFHDIPALSALIGNGSETGTEVRKRALKFPGLDGRKRLVETSALPTQDRSGARESVVCVFREVAPPSPKA
ncbi:MAG TPA: PAS domain-containing protein [Terriglobia bacterium]|nr:PAS domain-containing protein [Terriglobia bacterium]